ncbi:MAG: peptide chain release factor N(5)-glutamine methyltransferase [Clostridia bacterium]|nr:peptide chain release factor N(5)-glutamine methyltransferase [Clostridia bacterium]
MNREKITARLLEAGIENAAGEAALLTEAFDNEALTRAVERRCAHYPLQYILGTWDFYRERYKVNEHCLIPRSDTEILVDTAIKMLPNGAHFLDLCTGSGCVAISTLANRPDTVATAIDLFPQTLALATENAQSNNVSARFTPLLANVLEAPPNLLFRDTFAAILSNPPYIRDEVVPTLQQEVAHEPRAALCGGPDGLDFYRAILEKWTALLSRDGAVLFEIGYDQKQDITALAAKYGYTCDVKKDFGGNDRVAILRRR